MKLAKTAALAALFGSVASLASAEDVSLRLSWLMNVQSAGYVMALEKGFYAEEGLNVTIEPGGPNLNSAALVASGANTFGTNDVIALVNGAAQGMPLQMVGGCFQRHPAGLIVRADAGIASPADLIGKNMAYNEGGPWTLVQAMLAANDIAVSDINTTVSTAVELLAEGRVDAKTGFTVNEPLSLAAMGVETISLVPSDYGVNTYAEIVFTNQAFAAEKPEVVAAFMRATQRGYDYAYENKAETVETLVKLNPQLDPVQQTQQMDLQESYVYTDYSREHGACAFETSVVTETEQMLRDITGLTGEIDLDAIASTAFLPK